MTFPLKRTSSENRGRFFNSLYVKTILLSLNDDEGNFMSMLLMLSFFLLPITLNEKRCRSMPDFSLNCRRLTLAFRESFLNALRDIIPERLLTSICDVFNLPSVFGNDITSYLKFPFCIRREFIRKSIFELFAFLSLLDKASMINCRFVGELLSFRLTLR